MIWLISGLVTSYARAKAESLGFRCDVGFVERGERLVGSLMSTASTASACRTSRRSPSRALAAGSPPP